MVLVIVPVVVAVYVVVDDVVVGVAQVVAVLYYRDQTWFFMH